VQILPPEIIDQEFARRSHEEFMRYMWQRPFDPFVAGKHTRVICERLDRAVVDFRRGLSTYLAIMVPFGHGKSDIASRYFPAHWAGMFPDQPVIVTGYSSGLTEGFSSDCQSILRDDRFQKLYPGVEISKKKASADEWHIEGRMGKLYWPGLTGSITGKRAALGICDDFFSGREEAESETIRNARWNTLVNDFLTRAYTHCVIIILATPWHVDDFFGRIKKRMAESSRFPAFEFLKFPAFSEEYPTGTLFPERYNESWYEGQRETLGPYATASLMQCDPVVEHGNYFRIDKIKYYEKPPTDRVRWTRGWDLALTEKQTIKDDPDFTAGIRLGVEWMPAIPGAEPMPVLYIDDFVLGRWEVHKRDHVIRQTAMDDGEIEIGVEAYGTQRESYDRLSAALYGVRTVTKRNPPKDLFARADAVRKCFEVGNVFMRRAPWNDELLRYLAEYPGAAHDDPIAALVTAFELHKPFVKHVFPHMVSLHTQPFDIHWGKRDERSSLHYGAVSMRKDLSLYVLATLWDDVAGAFFVYDCRSFDEPDVEKAVSWMGTHMRLRQYRVDRVLCNDRMSEGSDGAEKNMQKLFRDEFKKQRLLARLTEPTRYDQWGAISQINRLCTDRKIFFNDLVEPALMQFSGWSLDKGKPTDDGNIGYCEALCLIVAELKKKQVFKQRFRPGDYLRQEEYQKKLMQDPIRLERTAV
jgi:predicted phage terminase large subunit-like protein